MDLEAAAAADGEVSPEPATKRRKKPADDTSANAGEEAASPKKSKAAADEGPAALSGDDFRKKHFITSTRAGAEALPEPIQRFEDAPFGKKTRAGLVAAGFAAPSPIQAQAWPIAVAGQDLVAVAKTGSGKTLGFLLPAFRLIGKSEVALSKGSAATPPVLVIAPTRELVSQIEAECHKFQDYSKVVSLAVFGGAPKGPQGRALKETPPHVLVATPGRLQDFMEMKAVKLGSFWVCLRVRKWGSVGIRSRSSVKIGGRTTVD